MDSYDPYNDPNNLEAALFKFEIGFFKDYLQTMERFLEAESQHLVKSMEGPPANGDAMSSNKESSPGRDGTWTEEDDESWRLDEELAYERTELQVRLATLYGFANLLRSSFFVSLYSFLESRMVKECHSRKIEHIALKLSDLAGQNDLDKVEKYFAKVLRIYFPSDTAEWQEIKNYRLLRNRIVHRRGDLDDKRDDTKKLRNYCETNSILDSTGYAVSLDARFCNEAYEAITKFLTRLLFSNQEHLEITIEPVD